MMTRKRRMVVVFAAVVAVLASGLAFAGSGVESPVLPDGWWGSSEVVLPSTSGGTVLVSAAGESLRSMTRVGLVDGSVAVEAVQVFRGHAVASFTWSSEVVIVRFEVTGGGLRAVSLEHRTPDARELVDLMNPEAGVVLAGIVSPAFEDALHAFSVMDQPPPVSTNPGLQCIWGCQDQCEKYPGAAWYVCYLSCEAGCLIGQHI